MDIRDEKCHVYEQLKLLMEERRELSRQYYDLKEYLIHLEEDKIVSDSSDELSQETKFSNFKSEKVLQDYLIQRKMMIFFPIIEIS